MTYKGLVQRKDFGSEVNENEKRLIPVNYFMTLPVLGDSIQGNLTSQLNTKCGCNL